MDEHLPKPRRQVRAVQTATSIASDAFSQLALWTAANLAGMVTALLILRRPFFRKVSKQVGIGRVGGRKPSANRSLAILSDAVLGSSKNNIANVFGPPRAAVVAGPVSENGDRYFQADTWYYPLARQGTLAMAIAFQEGYARKVEFFAAPKTRRLPR